MLIPLIFLVLSTGFVVTLLMALMKMLGKDWDKEPFTGASVFSLFKLPLLFFLFFVIFVMVILPKMEG